MAISTLLAHLEAHHPGDLIGVYLYGSAVTGRVLPDSDVDLLLITGRSLTGTERRGLTSLLLRRSGWRGHAQHFPEASARRPIEVTAVLADDARSHRPRHDFQYGEWLRAELHDSAIPEPAENPDVVILLATAWAAYRTLRGPDLRDMIEKVPPEQLRQAMVESIPDLLDGVAGDERNTLLTLARILVTLETERIVPKDEAADIVASQLRGTDRELLEQARAGYLGHGDDDWTGQIPAVEELARRLAEQAQQHAA